MPRRLENDRWLFGVTLALCLFGAVMIFSASAVTAEQQYGHSYIFLARQAAWLLIGLLGMFALMKTDPGDEGSGRLIASEGNTHNNYVLTLARSAAGRTNSQPGYQRRGE